MMYDVYDAPPTPPTIPEGFLPCSGQSSDAAAFVHFVLDIREGAPPPGGRREGEEDLRSI